MRVSFLSQQVASQRPWLIRQREIRFARLPSRSWDVSRRAPLATTSLGNKKTVSGPTLSLWYPVLGGLIVTTLGGAKYVHDHVGGSEGLQRSLSFYALAVPKYLEYRFHMWKDSPDDVWDDLDRETSEQGLQKILELRGFYIKCGQMCASNIGNAFPPIWQDTMSVLQDQVPPQSFDVIRSVIDQELDFDATFASFDPEPIGAASIGQVHKATLRDGRPVVVKVRYPDVERLLTGDVRTIKMFAQVAQPVHVPALEEIEKQFQTEFDYRMEALQLNEVRENLIQAGLAGPGKMCQVPKPYMDLCTKCVLVMEELRGDKLAVELKRDLEHHAARAGQSVKQYMEAVQNKERECEAQGKEWVGPSSSEYDLYIAVVDGKRRIQNAWNRIYNTLMGWAPGVAKRNYEDRSELPLNHAKLVDDLFYVHGHEVLVNGVFNGDPHPGNILLCRSYDGTPQLGLIDYGQVKRLSKENRVLFAKLIVALDDDNRDEIIRLMQEAGFRSQKMDPEVIYLYAKVGYDQDNASLTNNMHIQMFMEELESRDPIIQLPNDFIMISRASLILRGLSHALHQSRSVARCWRPLAERVIQEEA
jgi:aarF domain-containing kinase